MIPQELFLAPFRPHSTFYPRRILNPPGFKCHLYATTLKSWHWLLPQSPDLYSRYRVSYNNFNFYNCQLLLLIFSPQTLLLLSVVAKFASLLSRNHNHSHCQVPPSCLSSESLVTSTLDLGLPSCGNHYLGLISIYSSRVVASYLVLTPAASSQCSSLPHYYERNFPNNNICYFQFLAFKTFFCSLLPSE